MTKMSIRGISLNVKVMGKGYPLVLMHGGPGLDHTSLLPLKPLADQFTLVFYDHRCNGHSEGAEVSTMTMDNLTADADALRQALGFEKWALFGHSFGGNVALEYALRYSQNLSHLILTDTGGDQWWVNHNAMDILAQRGYSPSTVEAARRFFNGQVTPGEFLPTSLKFMSAYYHHLTLLGFTKDFIFGPTPKMRPEALIFGYSQMLKGWTVMDRLGEIKVPTLVMAGRDDFLFPPEHQVMLANGLPDAQLKFIERAGHEAPSEQPAEIIEAVRNFISTTTPGKS